MSAHSIYEHAPLGAMISYSDGTPRPPARHNKKLQAWEGRNNRGRLVSKREGVDKGTLNLAASFTLHEADFGSGSTIILRVFKSFSVDNNLCFTVSELPKPGSILLLSRPGDGAELVHLAVNRQDADQWLQKHGYPNAVLQEVASDGSVINLVEGRAA